MDSNKKPTKTWQVPAAEIVGIEFGLATSRDIRRACISDCSISLSSQLTNPFLGLPLEQGKCESCGTAEPGKCEGHFGYIELPVPIYHPCYVKELKHMLSLLCWKCLRLKKKTLRQVNRASSVGETFTCCRETAKISINEVKKDGVIFLELKVPKHDEPNWSFMERYGYRYGENQTRPILPFEVMHMLKRIPADSKKILIEKGFFPQEGYIMSFLPVPPNCLSIPEASDDTRTFSSNLVMPFLKKVTAKIRVIRETRSDPPTFESHEVEAIDLQFAVEQYLNVRGIGKTERNGNTKLGIQQHSQKVTTTAWLEKMRTLFIKKGCGFSSRGVITGDTYKRVNEIGIPLEIAKKISFEERVNNHNLSYLQKLVDAKECLAYHDGLSTFSLTENSGQTSLQLGQVVHRRIKDGDLVFINRPPTIHKHSLQALSVYIHEDLTVKINPLVCSPLSADFDGDCIHLFYPQSVAAKAEASELFSLEQQLLSSHNGNLLLQLSNDSLLSMKKLCKEKNLPVEMTQELLMFVSCLSSQADFYDAKAVNHKFGVLEILETCLPLNLDISSETYCIRKSKIKSLDLSKNLQITINDISSSIYSHKGPNATLMFFNSLQPLLMEYIFSRGFSFGLKDMYIPMSDLNTVLDTHDPYSSLLSKHRADIRERVEKLVEDQFWNTQKAVLDLIMHSSTISDIVDLKSQSDLRKFIQQIGFLGLQITHGGKFHSKTLSEDIMTHFESHHPNSENYEAAKYGLIKGCFVYGLDPYETIIHSISVREITVRSSMGLSEPGTLFKNIMAILRDVVINYDGTVRNISSDSIIQFQYDDKTRGDSKSFFAGEPVGVLAATAISSSSYKAVLDSSVNGRASWEKIKEVLRCRVNGKKEVADHRVMLYLKNCNCGRIYCLEKTAYSVKNHLEKVLLKDIVDSFVIEYKREDSSFENDFVGLCGHVRLNKRKMKLHGLDMDDILQKCDQRLSSLFQKKKIGGIFKMVTLFICRSCSIEQRGTGEHHEFHCLMFWLKGMEELPLENISDLLSSVIFPVLSESTIQGDDRISSVNIAWITPQSSTWIRHPSGTLNAEVAVELILEKTAVTKDGDGWRVALDCCLPCLPLIDTTRSLPYAVKQVQNFLGISCAFGQAVQRLSTSVSGVAKGVLTKHLILISSSMSYTGNMVGFTPSGYKVLSRSCDTQGPFTEAMLFMPKKCFERAAVKCHVDKLSSVVAACSWGKRVGVGTGSAFDIIWSDKQSSLVQENGLDPYEILSLESSEFEALSSGLGAGYNDMMTDKFDGWNNSTNCNAEENPWGQSATINDLIVNSSSGWTCAPNNDDKNEGCNPWNQSSQSNDQLPEIPSSGWNSSGEGPEAREVLLDDAWNTNDTEIEIERSSSRVVGDLPSSSGWGPEDNNRMEGNFDGWNCSTIRNEEENSWVQSDLNDSGPNIASGWTCSDRNDENTNEDHRWNQASQSAVHTTETPSSNWYTNSGRETTRKDMSSDAWKVNVSNVEIERSQPSVGTDLPSSGLGAEDNDRMRETFNGWNESTHFTEGEGAWTQPSNIIDSVPNLASDWTGSGNKDNSEECDQWNQSCPFVGPNAETTWSDWNTNREVTVCNDKSDHSWKANASKTEPSYWKRSSSKNVREDVYDDMSNSAWNANDRRTYIRKFQSKNSSLPTRGSFERGDGTSKNIQFSAEEQEIMSDVTPMIETARRILHESGYADGDLLSEADQTYMINNIFTYHPCKTDKVGAGIDHMTINRHDLFPETRCFFIISTDGQKQDFSYLKCIQEFVRKMYPLSAEGFIDKCPFFSKKKGSR